MAWHIIKLDDTRHRTVVINKNLTKTDNVEIRIEPRKQNGLDIDYLIVIDNKIKKEYPLHELYKIPEI